MARGQMQREQGVAVGREWAGRSTVGVMNHRVRCSGFPGPIGWSRRGRAGAAARAGGRGSTGWASLA